jgi:hypothetical protein
MATYGLSFKRENVSEKHALLLDMYYSIPFWKDDWWFFALHPNGMTLRCSPLFEKRVTKYLKKRKVSFKKDRYYYDPQRHEYYGVHVFGEDMVRVFHSLSILIILYSPRISLYPTLERLGHMLINMAGIHNFSQESDYYLALAEGRRKIIGHSLPLPKWVYSFWAKISSQWFTHETYKKL